MKTLAFLQAIRGHFELTPIVLLSLLALGALIVLLNFADRRRP